MTDIENYNILAGMNKELSDVSLHEPSFLYYGILARQNATIQLPVKGNIYRK